MGLLEFDKLPINTLVGTYQCIDRKFIKFE